MTIADKQVNKRVHKLANKLQLDTTGLLCPEPVMLLHKKIREMVVGDMVEVIATDPSTQRDIPKFCQFLGHTLQEQMENDKNYYYLIEKK